jgi:hypothetical protein
MFKKCAKLDNWFRVNNKLAGVVSGHPNFNNGTEVITSNVVEIDLANKKAETQNTMYSLGKPREISY